MFLFLLLFWIILNGKITVEIILVGCIISALFILFANKFMGYTFLKEKRFWRKLPFIVKYIVILIVEIIKANLIVLKILFTPGRKVAPVLVHFRSPLKKEIYKVVLADSITLTPGTITVRLNDDGYLVHCLDESLAEGLDSSVFVELLKKMEEQ